MVGDTGVADGPEVDGVETLDALYPVLVHHPAGLQVEVAPPGQLGELAAEVALFRRHVGHAHPGRDDFLADTVAGDDCDAISLHISSLRIYEFTDSKNGISRRQDSDNS